MLKNFTLIALSCFLIAFATSCTKDTTGTGTNPGGTSVYSFDGNPGSCSAPAVAGFYSVGTQLNSTNTLTFNINVVAKGSYSITTTGANGVWFSGSGMFTATGPQTVVLTGNGIPSKKGNFPFVPVTNNTCNFSVSFLDGAPAAVFTYAGGTAACTAPSINGTYASGVSLGSGNYVDLAVNVTTAGAYTVGTTSAGGISFSGNGVFTSTGAQVIRLIGNGTPSGTGTFAYTPSGGCSFSITIAPPPPPASFTYTCATPTITGTYAAGTALNSTNTIVVPVNVSTAGLYSVSTNTDNGVTFSASGVFSGTGAQTITLRSTNTPTAGGTFTYTPSGAGCSFDITYTGGGGGGGGGDVLKCTIDGTPMDFSSGASGFLSGGSFSAAGYIGNAKLEIQLNDNNADIAVGSYSKLSLSNMDKYNLTTYWPNFVTNPGTFWLPGFMNSNAFTVTVQTITATTITGVFSGDLFDASGGNKRIVTNGSFSISH